METTSLGKPRHHLLGRGRRASAMVQAVQTAAHRTKITPELLQRAVRVQTEAILPVILIEALPAERPSPHASLPLCRSRRRLRPRRPPMDPMAGLGARRELGRECCWRPLPRTAVAAADLRAAHLMTLPRPAVPCIMPRPARRASCRDVLHPLRLGLLPARLPLRPLRPLRPRWRIVVEVCAQLQCFLRFSTAFGPAASTRSRATGGRRSREGTWCAR